MRIDVHNGARRVGSKDVAIGPTRSEKIKNAETMHGTGSVQHKEAVRRFGGKDADGDNPREEGRLAALAGKFQSHNPYSAMGVRSERARYNQWMQGWNVGNQENKSGSKDASYHAVAGQEAKAKGQPESDNPYPKGSDPHRLWQEGYRGQTKKAYDANLSVGVRVVSKETGERKHLVLAWPGNPSRREIVDYVAKTYPQFSIERIEDAAYDFATERGYVVTVQSASSSWQSPMFITRQRAEEWLRTEVQKAKQTVAGIISFRQVDPALMADARSDPPYVRARENQYIGREALHRRHEIENLKQLTWQLKNMPSSLSEEERAKLRVAGKIKDDKSIDARDLPLNQEEEERKFLEKYKDLTPSSKKDKPAGDAILDNLVKLPLSDLLRADTDDRNGEVWVMVGRAVVDGPYASHRQASAMIQDAIERKKRTSDAASESDVAEAAAKYEGDEAAASKALKEEGWSLADVLRVVGRIRKNLKTKTGDAGSVEMYEKMKMSTLISIAKGLKIDQHKIDAAMGSSNSYRAMADLIVKTETNGHDSCHAGCDCDDCLGGARDASSEEIEREYQQLRSASKEYLARQVMGRLDHRSAMSAPKSDLINQILNDKFSRKDLDAWGK